MSNPLPEEKELYRRLRNESVAIKENVWNFIYNRVNDNLTAIILICQRGLKSDRALAIRDARRILAWIKDIKNAINSVTTTASENMSFPQFQDEIPLNSLVQELMTHYFGNDIYAIELMLQDAIDPLKQAPVSAPILQKIIVHTQAMKEFIENFRESIQWRESKDKYLNLYDTFQDGLALTDMHGHIVEANSAFVHMLNYSKEEITKLDYRQLTPEKWRKTDEEFINQLVLNKVNSAEYEKEYIKKGGGTCFIKRKVWLIKDKEDNPLGMWEVVKDITESKRVQREFEEEIFASYVVIENVSIGLSLSDKSGRFIIFNHRMQEITGYTMEESNKQDLGVLLYPDPEYRQEAISRLSEITAGKELKDVQTTITVRDGSQKVLSVSTSLINYKGRDMYLSVWRDITESKRLQDALNDSETRFRRLFETAQDGILILNAQTGQINEVNKFLIDMLGYSREEFLNKKLWDIGVFIDVEKSKAAFNELQASGYVRYEDLPLKTKDGRIINVEFVSNVYRVDHMEVIQCNIRDISERRHLEVAMQNSETRFRRLFEAAQDGILILNAQTGQINEVNKFLIDMLGYSREEFLNKKLWDIGVFIDVEKSKAAFNELQASGYVRYEDLPLKTKDGRTINVEFVSNIYDVGQAKVIQCNIRDISERKALEVKLNTELEQLALRDSHTGLYNHRYLKDSIETNFARAERQSGLLSVLMIDLDYFKSINDVYGHLFGDLVLKQFAAQLIKAVRPYDVVIRYGGEEFVIVSPDTGRGGALILAQRILDKIQVYDFGDKGQSVRLKLSLSVASYPEDSVRSGMELVDLADQFLNKAKENGGSRVFSSSDIKKTLKVSMQPTSVHLLKEKIDKLTKRANQSLIEETMAFARALQLKDLYTGEHAEKTVYYALKISQQLNLTSEKIELIKQAAMLHDLGKVGISDKILHKRNKLTKTEFAEIKRHPQIGVDIIRPIHALRPVIPALLYHHERWDGAGYPQGLKGQQIPLAARIIAIADVYQALVSDRPYRRAFGEEKAVAIMKKGAGNHFDPDIVKKLLMVIRDEK